MNTEKNPLVIMFFGSLLIQLFLMPLISIDSIDDFRLSQNQLYVGICMATCMVFLESYMYPFSRGTWVFFILLGLGSFFAIRYQIGISDTEYLHDMIPHHSMAILTSKAIRRRTRNPKIYKVSNNIVDTQRKEIVQMKLLTAY